MLQSALAMSMDQSPAPPAYTPDNLNADAMTEEQQIALALQMSLADGGSAMETDTTQVTAAADAEKPSVSDYSRFYCLHKTKCDCA